MRFETSHREPQVAASTDDFSSFCLLQPTLLLGEECRDGGEALRRDIPSPAV